MFVRGPFSGSPPSAFPPYLPAPCLTPWVGCSCCLFSTENVGRARRRCLVTLDAEVKCNSLEVAPVRLLDRHLESGLSCHFACLLLQCWGQIMNRSLGESGQGSHRHKEHLPTHPSCTLGHLTPGSLRVTDYK